MLLACGHRGVGLRRLGNKVLCGQLQSVHAIQGAAHLLVELRKILIRFIGAHGLTIGLPMVKLPPTQALYSDSVHRAGCAVLFFNVVIGLSFLRC